MDFINNLIFTFIKQNIKIDVEKLYSQVPGRRR